MKSTGYVLKPRLYRTNVMPPNALEDTSQFGNNGVFGPGAQAPTWVQEPSGLWVPHFDGIDDFISVADAASLRPSPPFTIAFWFWPETLVDLTWILDKYQFAGTDKGWEFTTNADVPQKIYFALHNTAGGTAWTVATAVNYNAWNFIVGGLDAEIFCYVNNVPQGVVTGFAGTFAPSNDSLRIAVRGALYQKQKLIITGMYNRLLSAGDIYSKFQAERRWFNA